MYKVTIPSYVKDSNYFWYVNRCLHSLKKENKISLEYVPQVPIFSPFVATITIEGKKKILDVRDDSELPLPDIQQNAEGTLVYKSNFSLELWNTPPETFEYKLPEEHKKYVSFCRPFIFGRAFSWPLDINEKEYCSRHLSPITKKIVSLSGEGIFAQQTLGRLQVYDVIYSSFKKEDIELFWNKRPHFQDRDKIKDYSLLTNKFSKPKDTVLHNYESYINWLSMGTYSLNMPGIACSQPFRLVDAVLSQRAIISSKCWSEQFNDFPFVKIDMDGYFKSTEEQVNNTKEQLKKLTYNIPLQEMNAWYDKYLSVDGMWNQLIQGL